MKYPGTRQRINELAGLNEAKGYDPQKLFSSVHKTYTNLAMYMKRNQWHEAELMAKSLTKQMAQLEEMLSAVQRQGKV